MLAMFGKSLRGIRGLGQEGGGGGGLKPVNKFWRITSGSHGGVTEKKGGVGWGEERRDEPDNDCPDPLGGDKARKNTARDRVRGLVTTWWGDRLEVKRRKIKKKKGFRK